MMAKVEKPKPLFKDPKEFRQENDSSRETLEYLIANCNINFLPDDNKLQAMYNEIIDILTVDTINEELPSEKYKYDLTYPICWFRSSMFVSVFGNKFIRSIFNSTAENPSDQLITLTKAISNIFEKRDGKIPGQKDVYYNSVKNNSKYIMMETIILFYMVLLNKYDNFYSNRKQIDALFKIYNQNKVELVRQADDKLIIGKGYTPQRFALQYFLYDFMKLFGTPPLVLLQSIEHIPYYQTDNTPVKTTDKAPFIVSFMYSKDTHTTPTDVLFCNHNNTQYTLTSISIVNYNNTDVSICHVIGVYCSTNYRFYSWENGITDSCLLEHIILNLDLDGVNWWNRSRLFFNAKKGILMYIYTPTIPLFSFQEVQHLRELAAYVYQEKNKEIRKVTLSSLFACFRPTRILPVEAQTELNLPRFIAILLYFVRKCTVTFEGSEGSEVLALSCEPVNDGDYTLTIFQGTANTEFYIQLEVVVNDDTFITHYVNTLQNKLQKFVNKKLNTISNTMCRYSEHTRTINYMMNVINRYIKQKQAPPKGGRQKKRELIMKKTQKVYKIRINKAKQSYILMNKKKVLLADIKGRYTLRRCD